MWNKKQFCSITKLSADSLRHYEKIYLISPKRKENNYRIYSEVEYRQVQYIKVLQYLGFSLKEINQLLMLDNSEVNEECKVLTDEFFAEKIQQIENVVNDYVYVLDELKSFMDMRESFFPFDTNRIKDFTDKVVNEVFHRISERSTE